MIVESNHNLGEIYEIEMLANNHIAGLLPMEMSVSDGITRYWFNITGKQSLSDFLERQWVTYELLSTILYSLEHLAIDLHKYMLEEQKIWIKENYIYFDFDGEKMYVVYLPGKQGDFIQELHELMEFLLQKLNHSDKMAVAMGYEMYQLTMQNGITIAKIVRQVIKKVAPEENEGCIALTSESIIDKEPLPLNEKSESAPEFKSNMEEPTEFIKNQKKKSFVLQWKNIQLKLLSFIKPKHKADKVNNYVTYVTEVDKMEIHPTEYLGNDNLETGKLIYQGLGEQPDIMIDKPVFLIGKNDQEVNGYINQKSVSRIHAKIETEQDDYYIEDLNSTNGTFLNGERLEYRQRVKLSTKDRVMFGIVEFVFV
jgi:hypothetical protein